MKRTFACVLVAWFPAATALAVPTANGWDTDHIYVLRSINGGTFPDGEIRKLRESAPDPLNADLGRFGTDLPDDGKDKSICFSNSPTPGVFAPAGPRLWGVYNYPADINDNSPTDFVVVEFDVNANEVRRFYGGGAVTGSNGNLYGPNGVIRVGNIRYNPAKQTIAVAANVALTNGGITNGTQKGLVYEFALPDWPAGLSTAALVQRYEMPNPHNVAGDNGNISSPLVIDFDNDGNMYATNKHFNATHGPPGFGLYWGDVVRCNTLGRTAGLDTYVIPVTGADAANLVIDAQVEEALGHTDYLTGGQGIAVRTAFNQLVLVPSLDPPTTIGIYSLTQRVGGGSTGNLVRVKTRTPPPRQARYAQRDYDSGKIYFGNRLGDGPPGNFRYLQSNPPTDSIVVDMGFFLIAPCGTNCDLNRTWDAASPPFFSTTPPEEPAADADDDGDVDLDDHGFFQACLTGSGNFFNDPACAKVDLDEDFDVDRDDLDLFIACLSGKNVPAAPGCTD